MITEKERHDLIANHLIIDYWLIQICVLIMMMVGTIPIKYAVSFGIYLLMQPVMFLVWAWLCCKTSFSLKWCKKVAKVFK